MNIEHPTSNLEWEKKETEEYIKIFVTSVKTAEKKQKWLFNVCNTTQRLLGRGEGGEQ